MSYGDLQVKFCGFTCKNPFFLAASPVARTGEMISRAFDAGWGGAITKSVSLDQDLPDHSLSPRFAGIRPGGSNTQLQANVPGLGNIDFRIDTSVKDTFHSFEKMKANYPDHMLIISIKGNYIKEEWQKLAQSAEDAGADGIECCLSCPDCDGGAIGQNPVSVRQVIEWIKRVTNLPVIVKLTGHVASISQIAKVAKESGAEAVSAVNTFKGIGGVNLRTKFPLPTIQKKSTSVGISGGLIKSLAQYQVYEIARALPGYPISGVGGITCGLDALEYLMLGATTVQVATQVMYEGYEVVKSFTDSIENYLNINKIVSINDVIGSQLSNMVSGTSYLKRDQQLRAYVDDELCIRCGRCYTSCNDGAYQAIKISNDRSIKIDREKCVGCGLCRLVCPVPGAIFYTQFDTPSIKVDDLN